MTRMTATNIEVGDRVEVRTGGSTINRPFPGVTSAGKPGEAVEFATVASIEKRRSGITWTFSDGRIMFTSSNSKVTTS